jgi:hypothetical protein
VSVAEKPLFILDGKEISIEEFNRLNPNCVEDLKIIKGEEAVNKYGEKAANGVLAITTKQCPRAELKVASTPVAEKPLFILNGKEILRRTNLRRHARGLGGDTRGDHCHEWLCVDKQPQVDIHQGIQTRIIKD